MQGMNDPHKLATDGTAGVGNDDPPKAPSATVARATGRTDRWRSDQLLGPRKEVEIIHAGAIYRLRVTALGKLILTK
jgi:hemin uptake protein HemP